MNRTVPVGLNVPTPHYQALTRIAADKGVQVHALVEQLIARALNPHGAARSQAAARTLHGSALTAEIRKMHAEGHTDRSIGKALGLERDIVCQRRIAMHLPLNPDRMKHPPADPTRVRELHAEGLTDNLIAERLGTTASRVQRVRSEVLHLPSNRARSQSPTA